MGEMFSWYIDNNNYFTEEFTEKMIGYSLEAQKDNINIKDVVKRNNPNIGNESANPTAAKDFGIINNDSKLSDGSIMYKSKFYRYSDFVLDQISKRNVSKSKKIPLKPLVVLAKSFDYMRLLNTNEKDCFLTTEECYKYLSVLENYDELTLELISSIITNREYKGNSKIPKKTIQKMSNGVCLNELFYALADSKLFEFGKQKSIIKPVAKYWECIRYIAENGSNISQSPVVTGGNKKELYSYLCDINTGIKEIIPEIEFIKLPNKRLSKKLYMYLFGVTKQGFNWCEYFNKDYFGVYRIFYPIERIVLAKIYAKYIDVAEMLCDYSIQEKPFIEELRGGRLMIVEPFKNGHTSIHELNDDRKINYKTGIKKDCKRNRIIFGAPGTGKSFSLNKACIELLGEEHKNNYERVTFHPDYSYASFVGSYKPVMVKKSGALCDGDKKAIMDVLLDRSKSAQEKYDLLYDVFKEDGLTRLPLLLGLYTDETFKTKKQDGTNAVGDNSVERNHGRAIRPYVNLVTTTNSFDEDIAYEYVPGPFMRVLSQALKSAMTDSPEPYLLVVEEINRANVAAVFGDVFQLLDRNGENISEYEIATTNDMRVYLAKELQVDESQVATIKIPDNMFIWATMNSADQGVFPMDTAFKRRWDFTYLGIDDAEEKMSKKIKERQFVFGSGEYARLLTWNDIRRAINDELSSETYNINEDKLLGPYFITKTVLEDSSDEEFIRVFKNKVIMYLFEDAVKQKRKTFFDNCKYDSKGVRYSEICKLFDIKGVFIFPDAVSKKFTNRPIEDSKEEIAE